ncbi:MAG: hypothetical protein RL220_74 [Bacteroidota bacterium]
MNQFKELLKRYEVPASLNEDQAWDQLQQKIASGRRSSAPEGRVVQFRWARVAVAAAVVVITGGAFLYLNSEPVMVTFAQEKGGFRTLPLPDGSEVMLNAGSTLQYAEDFAEERLVKLDGEAYFSVKKGEKFTVTTPSGDVTVLGTTFNVYARPDKFEVRCNSGKVKVTRDGRDTEITAGMGVLIRGNVTEMLSFTPDELTASYSEAEFTGEALSNVFQEIERHFNVNIEMSGIGEGKFDGVVPMTGDVAEALDIVCSAMGLTWERGNDNWILVKK